MISNLGASASRIGLYRYNLLYLSLIVSTAVISLFFLVIFSGVTHASANAEEAAQPPSSIADNICKGVLSSEGKSVSKETTVESCIEQGDDSFSFIVRRIINLFSVIVGAVSVIMVIVGGFRYIISGGDSTGVSGAKNTILYAIVGLVIVLFAQIIIRFVLTSVTLVS